MNMNVLYFCSDAFAKVAATTIISTLEKNKRFKFGFIFFLLLCIEEYSNMIMFSI